MKIASLQLEIFFISDLHLTANKEFDPSKRAQMRYENLVVETDFSPNKDDSRKWQATLRVKHQGAAGLNTPYSFSVEMVGFLAVAESYPADKLQMLVRTNGPSMLYGAAREVIRDLTARGPHPTVFLPGVSFCENSNAAKTPDVQTSASAK